MFFKKLIEKNYKGWKIYAQVNDSSETLFYAFKIKPNTLHETIKDTTIQSDNLEKIRQEISDRTDPVDDFYALEFLKNLKKRLENS